MRIKYYALIERKVVAIDDVIQWAQWMELARKNELLHVGSDYVGPFWVSTVFLGLDHGFVPWDGPQPVLFETMVFPRTEQDDPKDKANWRDEIMQRYCTLEQAEAGHKAIVESLKRHEADAIERAETLLAIVRQEVTGRSDG